MPAKLKLIRSTDYSGYTLNRLCAMVESSRCAYDTLADFIEDKAFTECDKGRLDPALERLGRLVIHFEQMPEKTDEADRDFADVCLLLGDMCVSKGRYADAREWFEKAVVVDDNYDVAYHSLAGVCMHMGDESSAVKAFEQEIHVAPGNYYTYLQLADLFEKKRKYDRFTSILEELLMRDPDNIRALHRLIRHHEHASKKTDVDLLRKRIIHADHELVKTELVIWTYHMCKSKRYEDALIFIENHELEKSGLILTRLLKAHIRGCLRQYSRKRQELATFVKMCSGNVDSINQRLREFAGIFGEKEADRLHVRTAAA